MLVSFLHLPFLRLLRYLHFGCTASYAPRERKARAAERSERVQTDNAFITTSTAEILAYYHVFRVGVIKRVSQLTDPF